MLVKKTPTISFKVCLCVCGWEVGIMCVCGGGGGGGGVASGYVCVEKGLILLDGYNYIMAPPVLS